MYMYVYVCILISQRTHVMSRVAILVILNAIGSGVFENVNGPGGGGL